MKVQFVLPDYGLTAGGGKTYFDDLFNALVECAGETTHEFFILEVNRGNPFPVLPHNIQWVTVKRSFWSRLFGRIEFRLRNWWLALTGAESVQKVEHPFRRAVRRCLAKHGIQLTLSCGPFVSHDALPFIVTVWDLAHRVLPSFPEFSRDWEWEGREEFYRTYLPKASRIITGTETGKDLIERCYGVPAEQISVLPLPTPTFALHQGGNRSREAGSFSLPDSYVFYPAQFWAHKNHVTLLRALAILEQEFGIKLDAVFCGSDKGNQRHVEANTRTLGLENRVHFLGFVSQNELVRLYENALALTFVTLLGPDNLPPLEAFGLGCPVIASNINGAREQLGECALFVDPASAADIAEAIKELHDNSKLREALIEKGRARVNGATAQQYIRSIFKILDSFEPVIDCWPSA